MAVQWWQRVFGKSQRTLDYVCTVCGKAYQVPIDSVDDASGSALASGIMHGCSCGAYASLRLRQLVEIEHAQAEAAQSAKDRQQRQRAAPSTLWMLGPNAKFSVRVALKRFFGGYVAVLELQEEVPERSLQRGTLVCGCFEEAWDEATPTLVAGRQVALHTLGEADLDEIYNLTGERFPAAKMWLRHGSETTSARLSARLRPEVALIRALEPPSGTEHLAGDIFLCLGGEYWVWTPATTRSQLLAAGLSAAEIGKCEAQIANRLVD